MGAWIEMGIEIGRIVGIESLPTWERGLKCPYVELCGEINQSLPTWERGLKCHIPFLIVLFPASLPTWERGLKLKQS